MGIISIENEIKQESLPVVTATTKEDSLNLPLFGNMSYQIARHLNAYEQANTPCPIPTSIQYQANQLENKARIGLLVDVKINPEGTLWDLCSGISVSSLAYSAFTGKRAVACDSNPQAISSASRFAKSLSLNRWKDKVSKIEELFKARRISAIDTLLGYDLPQGLIGESLFEQNARQVILVGPGTQIIPREWGLFLTIPHDWFLNLLPNLPLVKSARKRKYILDENIIYLNIYGAPFQHFAVTFTKRGK